MKHKIIILFITVWLHLSSNAQFEPIPESNKFTVYIDNIVVGNERGIDKSRIPCVFLESYYSKYIDFSANEPLPKKIKPKFIKKIYIEKDTILQKNSLHIRTNKAKDGYLFVNKSIMDKVANLNCELDKMKISYVYNNKAVTTKKGVMQVLGLREKHIQILEIIRDEKLGIITVYIINKK